MTGISVNPISVVISPENPVLKAAITEVECKVETTSVGVFVAPTESINYIVESDGGLLLQYLLEPVSVYTVVSASADGLIQADPFDFLTWKVQGIALESGIGGSNILVKYSGKIINPLWNWDLHRPIFVGVNGQLTQYAPSGASYLSEVGFPLTPQSIFVNIKDVVVL